MSENNNNKKNISNHIFPTSSNLLGLCFVILSFMKLFKLGHQSVIDELVAIALILFLISCLFSYASIRAKSRTDYYEKVADIVFLIGLSILTLIAIVITLELIH